MQLASNIPVLSIRRDKRRDGHRVAIGEQLGNLGDPADILVTVGFGETQVLVQAEADVVAIEAVGGDAALGEQVVLELDGDGGFARGREAGEPDCEAALAAQTGAFGAGEGCGVVGYVAGLRAVRWDCFRSSWTSFLGQKEPGTYVAMMGSMGRKERRVN
jgi:hypothetical protein